MQDSIPLGPVESDTVRWEKVAQHKFRKDSLLAQKKCDSLFAPLTYSDLIPRQQFNVSSGSELVPSIFQDHTLPPLAYGKLRPAAQPASWLSGFLLLIILLAAILNWRYFNRIKTLVDAFLLNRFVGQIVREENVFLNRVNVLLSVLYLLVVGIFSYISMEILGIHPVPGLSPGLTMMGIFTGLFLLFFLKMIVVLVSGFIFDQGKAAVEYVFSIFLYNQMAGLLLIPILIALLYIDLVDPYYLVITGIGLLLFFYLFRLFRIISGGLATPSVSVYYLFLYLCTLEFLPVAVTIKLITG